MEFQIFSYLGRTSTPEIDCDWLRITSAPGEYTVDTLKIAYDKLPDGVTDRMGHITLTDGASKLTLRVIQNGETASIDTATSASSLLAVLNDNSLRVEGCDPEQPVMIFAINGTILYNAIAPEGSAIIDTAAWAPGIYVIINGNNSFKFIK